MEADIPIAGKRARAYSLEFVNRIRSVKDDNARINIIETVKLRERAADIVRSPNYRTSTELFKCDFAYSFATVLRFLTPHTDDYKGITDTGTEYEIQDPDRTIQDILKGAFGANREDVKRRISAILSNTTLWSPADTALSGLDENQDFTERVTGYYHRLVSGETCLEVLEGINRDWL